MPRLPLALCGFGLLLFAGGDTLAVRHHPAASIEASMGGCGRGWATPHAGAQTLLVRNSGSEVAGVTLLDVATGAVHAEIEGLAPGTTRPMRVTLGAGTYAFRCLADGPTDPVTGPRVRIAGSARGGPAVVPVTENDLYGPVRTYQAHVARGLDRLVRATRELRAAVADGDRDAARAAWLPAHLAYERLGAAYGAFGDLDTAVNGLPQGLTRGVRDPAFTGFHRLEHGLWRGERMSALEGPAERLDRDVRTLRAGFSQQRVEPGDLGLRAHEILEDTVRFQLTGRADQGSGTTLRTAAAHLEGTRAVLAALAPVLRPRYPGLPGVYTWLDRADRLLSQTSPDRKRVNGTIGELLERLAPVAEICEPRRTS